MILGVDLRAENQRWWGEKGWGKREAEVTWVGFRKLLVARQMKPPERKAQDKTKSISDQNHRWRTVGCFSCSSGQVRYWASSKSLEISQIFFSCNGAWKLTRQLCWQEQNQPYVKTLIICPLPQICYIPDFLVKYFKIPKYMWEKYWNTVVRPCKSLT